MVQVPEPTMVTVVPETVHTLVVSVLKDHRQPELAVADTVNGGSPKLFPPSAAKVIAWLAFETVNDCDTCAGRAVVRIAGWFASMVHVPVATIVTVVPETVQTLVVAVLKATASPELELAEIVNGASPNTLSPSAPNVMNCVDFPTVKPCETCAAGL
jgi:hypothetical protein